VGSIVSYVDAIPGFCQPVSSLTHLVGAAATIAAAVPLLRLGRKSPGRVGAIAVYVVCVFTVLIVSGIYHSLEHGCRAREIMQQLDHYAIWLLIAGTFTAVHGVMCRGFWRSGLLTLVWGYAAAGILLQIFWFRTFSGVPGLVLYLGLGWVGIASIIKLGRQIGYREVRSIWYAGIAYTGGALLEALRQPAFLPAWLGPHEVFHLAVLVGVLIHWLFIRKLLLSYPLPAAIVPA
jgi:channel protein (hemolysin III family)